MMPRNLKENQHTLEFIGGQLVSGRGVKECDIFSNLTFTGNRYRNDQSAVYPVIKKAAENLKVDEETIWIKLRAGKKISFVTG